MRSQCNLAFLLLCICFSFSTETMIDTNEEEPGTGIQLIPGTDLILQCNTTDDPELDISWFKNGERLNMTDSRIIVENFNNTLTINQATEADTGNYTCATSTKMGTVNATIAVRTKIKLLSFDNSRNIVQGQSIILQCNVTQGTHPVNLQWLKDGISLNLSDPRIEVQDDYRGIPDAKVTIKEAEYEDRAEYTCLATNYLGQANTTILVRVKDKYAALWPFLGICVEVTILCAIIFVYEKRRQKPEFDESEGDHATENKTVSDQEDKSHDIRQRK